jgi:hypothetical protein
MEIIVDKKIKNKNVKILTLEAKDTLKKLAIVDGMTKKDIEELKENEYRILKNYRGSLDYSLLSIYLQRNHKNFMNYDKKSKRLYTNNIITVKFTYAQDDIEQLQNNESYDNSVFTLNVLKVERKQLAKEKNSIKGKVKRLKDKDEIDEDKVKSLENNLDEIKIKIKNIDMLIKDTKDKIKFIIEQYKMSTNKLRKKLYEDGFIVNVNGKNTRFYRFLRSSGSARVGKVNYINSDFYDEIIKWCMAGIEYKNGELDLPSLEAYISLVTSSIIDTIEIEPKNILLIDDAKSIFTDTVMSTELKNEIKDKNGNIIEGELDTNVKEKEIVNNLFDGESLLDKSLFDSKGYDDKAVLQLRNRFYKGIGINTDIQKFFEDNRITKIEQLKGETLATDVKDIKLITTKSSIKYLKYKSFEEWTTIMSDVWGICKYDKGQNHNFNNMVNTHYQLLNTLGMDKEAINELLKDTISYINLLKNDISVFKLHLGILKDCNLEDNNIEDDEDIERLEEIKNSSDFILNMLKINEDFAKTKMCRDYRNEVIKNYIKNSKKGHILVNGTYAVVINSAYEYLLCSIGKWNGKTSSIGIGECYTKKFEIGEDVLGVRSPQPTMSNMAVFKNVESGILKEYFNIESENVIYISAIGWNVMELESSMDFDGDAMMITNLRSITEHCKKLNETIKVDGKEIKRFLVSTDFTPKKFIPKTYNSFDLAETDIKCSQGKIGECINFVQMLNSVYWTKKKQGAKEEELLELYKDISNLNVLSCIIIDSAKKESPVNVKKEMDNIRAKGYLENGVRPFFFKYLDGGKDYTFEKFECGMDYLVTSLNSLQRKYRDNTNGNIAIKDLLLKQKAENADRKKIQKIVGLVKEMQIKLSNIYSSKEDVKDKFKQASRIREEYYDKISKIELTSVMIYTILKRLNDSYVNENSKFVEYRKIGRNLLKVLYNIDPVKFLSCFLVKSNKSGILVRDAEGDICIYGVKFKKIKNM